MHSSPSPMQHENELKRVVFTVRLSASIRLSHRASNFQRRHDRFASQRAPFCCLCKLTAIRLPALRSVHLSLVFRWMSRDSCGTPSLMRTDSISLLKDGAPRRRSRFQSGNRLASDLHVNTVKHTTLRYIRKRRFRCKKSGKKAHAAVFYN